MARIDRNSVAYTLRWLNNPIKLRDSALVNLPAVQLRLRDGQGDRFTPSYILRDFIRACCQRLDSIETTDKTLLLALAFLRLYSTDPNATRAARSLNIGHSCLYDTVMPMALDLLTEEMQIRAGAE